MTTRRKSKHGWAPSAGAVIDGRYRLVEMVDEGATGVVMRAEHVRMRREVAVKLLHPDVAVKAGYRDRFEREVDLATTIDHRNIVQCYDFGETDDGVLYLVMELLDGRSLGKLIEDERRIGTRRCVTLALELLDGVAAAHVRDIVHRDLKPGNVFVSEDHRGREIVKVLDFGLAKSLKSDDVRLTQTGAICGTASYIAPEALVLQQTGKEGDVYAIGLIMLEMLTGHKVCSSRFMGQTFLQHLVVPARIPRRIWDTPLGELLAAALRKHPGDRPANAEEMYQALASIEEEVPDFRLTGDEIPPAPEADLSEELLEDLSDGNYQDLETLKTLPRPEPWDSLSGDPDDRQTQQIVIANLERRAPTNDAPPAIADSPDALDQLETTPRLDDDVEPEQLDALQTAAAVPPAKDSDDSLERRVTEKVELPPAPTQPEESPRSPRKFVWVVVILAILSVGATVYVLLADPSSESAAVPPPTQSGPDAVQKAVSEKGRETESSSSPDEASAGRRAERVGEPEAESEAFAPEPPPNASESESVAEAEEPPRLRETANTDEIEAGRVSVEDERQRDPIGRTDEEDARPERQEPTDRDENGPAPKESPKAPDEKAEEKAKAKEAEKLLKKYLPSP